MYIKQLCYIILLCVAGTMVAASPSGWYRCSGTNKKLISTVHVVQSKTPHIYDVTWNKTHIDQPSKLAYHSDRSRWFIIGNQGLSSYSGYNHITDTVIVGTSLLSFKGNTLMVKSNGKNLFSNGKITMDSRQDRCVKINLRK